MLSLASSSRLRFCDRLTRREAMQVGALGTMGLGLPDLLRTRADAGTAGHGPLFGRAKRMILLFMWGGPAHQDTWDLKPEGPLESRGEFLPIATSAPGVFISEHFPLIARHADKLALLRSVGQDDNNHSTGAHAGLTGRRHELKAESFGARDTDFPHIGSVLSYLRPNTGGMPTFVALPEQIHTTNGALTPGQFAGLLGPKYDPFQIDEHPDRPNFSIESLRLPSGLTDVRMQHRRRLLSRIDDVARLADRSVATGALDAYYQQALDMVLSPQARRAFDLSSVPEDERWRYGRHAFGQSVLMARRLVEAGVQLVTVYWHRERKTIDTTWDTHARNFDELKSRLMPSVDRPIAALLEDLARGGLLDETLVVWNSEFGRTPRVNGSAGRDHWGPCNTVVMAGAGIPGGQVFGASDAAAAYPTSDKVTQDDVAATIYHLLGFAGETPVYDRTHRPYPVALGEPIFKLLGGDARPEVIAPARLRTEPAADSAFRTMLRERGGRFLHCDLCRPDAQWKLEGWSDAAALPAAESREERAESCRKAAGKSALVQYLGLFYNHFDYGVLAFHLAAPRPLGELRLTLNGQPIPMPDGLATSPARRLWQIPLPPGMISATTTFALQIQQADWELTDVAVLGDEIDESYPARFGIG